MKVWPEIFLILKEEEGEKERERRKRKRKEREEEEYFFLKTLQIWFKSLRRPGLQSGLVKALNNTYEIALEKN